MQGLGGCRWDPHQPGWEWEGRAREGGFSSAKGLDREGRGIPGSGPCVGKALEAHRGSHVYQQSRWVKEERSERVFSSCLANLDFPRDWEPRKVFVHRREEAKGLELAKARQTARKTADASPVRGGTSGGQRPPLDPDSTKLAIKGFRRDNWEK